MKYIYITLSIITLLATCPVASHASTRRQQRDSVSYTEKLLGVKKHDFETNDRFLPTSRRVDREINRIKYAYKGEWMLGFTASYATLNTLNNNYLVILDKVDLSGRIGSIRPFVGYFYRDNVCIGMRLSYFNARGSLGNVTVDLGEQNEIALSLGNIAYSSNDYAVGIFHRTYAGLDSKGRFALFGEMLLNYTNGNPVFKYKSGDSWRTTKTQSHRVALSFNPGLAVFLTPNVCGTLSFGLGGVEYTYIEQHDGKGNFIGTRQNSKLQFKLNLLDINIGMVFHLWGKK